MASINELIDSINSLDDEVLKANLMAQISTMYGGGYLKNESYLSSQQYALAKAKTSLATSYYQLQSEYYQNLLTPKKTNYYKIGLIALLVYLLLKKGR